MTASIAHEIRQPLAAIVTNANAGLRWLARSNPDVHEVRTAFHQIAKSGARITEVIESIRSMFGQASAQKGLVDSLVSLTPAVAQSSDQAVIHLNQAWSDDDREWYCHFSQGAAVLSYDIFLNLEVAGGRELFRSDANSVRYGLIPEGPNWMNPRRVTDRYQQDDCSDDDWRLAGGRLCRRDLRDVSRNAIGLQGQARSHRRRARQYVRYASLSSGSQRSDTGDIGGHSQIRSACRKAWSHKSRSQGQVTGAFRAPSRDNIPLCDTERGNVLALGASRVLMLSA